MLLLTLSTLPFAPRRAWTKLARQRPPLRWLVVAFVLPLALLPPLMLGLAHHYQPGMFPDVLARKPWALVVAAFLAAEMATLLLMGWLLRRVARTAALGLDDRDARLIAAVAPAPLWLASLALAGPGLLPALVLGGAALAACCAIVHHGLVVLGRAGDAMAAAAATHLVVGATLVPWVLLAAAAMA